MEEQSEWTRLWIFLFATATAALSFLSGFIMPRSDVWGGHVNFLNPFWSSVYGSGWGAAGLLIGLQHNVVSIFGFFVWPLAMLIVVGQTAAVAARRGGKWLLGFTAAFIASLCLLVGPAEAEREPLSRLPLFSNYLAAAY